MGKRALLVGINDYSFGPLAGCISDAQAMEAALARQEDGSPNFDCRLSTSDTTKITRASLKRQMQELFKDPADVCLLYFSGHGFANELGGYLVTPDATEYDQGVALNDVLTMANRSPAKEVVILLDSCQSGALGELPQISSGQAHLDEGVAILSASRRDQNASEANGRGMFTSLLEAALLGGAADVLGNVTVASAYAYIDQSLGPWDQRPMFKAHLSTLTALRKCKSSVPLETLRQFPGWFSTPDSEYPLDPSYEPDKTPLPDKKHNGEHEKIFKQLQKCRDAKLIIPVGEEHLYYAAIHSKSCQLTHLGKYYWRLANEGRL